MHKRRDVTVVDLPAAYMQADINELIQVCFEGVMTRLLEQLDPELYGPCLGQEGKTPALYVPLTKALYGTLKGALLSWKNLSATFKSWDFILNPYD